MTNWPKIGHSKTHNQNVSSRENGSEMAIMQVQSEMLLGSTTSRMSASLYRSSGAVAAFQLECFLFKELVDIAQSAATNDADNNNMVKTNEYRRCVFYPFCL